MGRADRSTGAGQNSLDCRGVPRPTGRGLSTTGRGPYPHIHSDAQRTTGRGFGYVPGADAASHSIHRPCDGAGGPCLFVEIQTPAPPNTAGGQRTTASGPRAGNRRHLHQTPDHASRPAGNCFGSAPTFCCRTCRHVKSTAKGPRITATLHAGARSCTSDAGKRRLEGLERGPRPNEHGPRATKNRQKKPATRAGKFEQGIAGPRPAGFTPCLW